MRIFFLPLALIALFAAGCESVKDRFTTRIDDAPAQTQDFDGKVESLYQAGQKAFKRLDFTLVRSSLGRIEAASSIHKSSVFGDARQLVATVEFHDVGPGKVEVAVRLTEDVSSQSVGGTHRTALRDHSFYQLYFATLQQVLAERAASGQPEKS